MFGIGAFELVIIMVVALIVLGPKRLPEMARSMGKALAEFRRTSSEIQSSLNISLTDPPPANPAAANPPTTFEPSATGAPETASTEEGETETTPAEDSENSTAGENSSTDPSADEEKNSAG